MAGLRGRAHVFGDDIDTDLIIPARYLNTSEPAELAKHAMEGADPEFPAKVRRGDFIVAGKNFGCGSSREHAPIAIRAAGVACVIARSYARIFYRNAFNQGLPILESAEAAGAIRPGDELEVDIETGAIRDLTTGQTFQARPIPPFMMEILHDGGLMPHILKKRAATVR
ncbi:MAG TPA: 3-isopropylmalate dehydratase small subunit [Thermodesulfobacteriota bacterium]|nr:3-isopropylmalate dehydratase small subunit [Thermodesulfobacteriota bacterium]